MQHFTKPKKNINSNEVGAKLFIEKIWDTWERLQVSQNLGDFGMDKSDTEMFVSDTMDLKAALDQNPLPFYENEIKSTLKKLKIG
tara:strand:+ start:230 stop:484 length:255 start_codon:yes stop_codon:yes gene_type:complete